MGQNTILGIWNTNSQNGGTFLQIMKVNPKMGFIWRAKHGLNKDGIKKTKVGLILGRRTKREGEGEEKRKRKKKEEPRSSQQGMKTHLDYEFYEIWHGSLVLYDYYLAQT